jgi:hypothetical protein
MDLHRPFVRVHPGPCPSVWDAVVAEDDFLVARWQSCTLCGRRASPLEQTLIVLATLALATLLCMRCRDNDPQLVALHAMLVQRYGDGREE